MRAWLPSCARACWSGLQARAGRRQPGERDERVFVGSPGNTGLVDATGTSALVHRPRGMTPDGTSIYWVECDRQTVRQGVIATRSVTTLVGTHCGGSTPCTGGYNEGTGTAALFTTPFDVVFHLPTGTLFVVDSNNYVIRAIR